MQRIFRKTLALPLILLLATVCARAQAPLRVIPDSLSYNVGSVVRLQILPTSEGSSSPQLHLTATIRYAGEAQPMVKGISPVLNSPAKPPAPAPEGAYQKFWTVPSDARSGRYEVDISGSGASSFDLPRAASFVVHRKLVKIERIELNKTFYTSGDAVSAVVTLRNLTGQLLSGLRVEFSKRYWPWIAQSSERAGVDVVNLAESLSLKAGDSTTVRSGRAAIAAMVKQPTAGQYAVVVWEHEGKDVLDIAFSPLAFINPPGVESPRPYAGLPGSALQYLHPDLPSIDTSSHRHFYPPGSETAAIEFDRSHTLFAPGDQASLKFSLFNRTPHDWKKVRLRLRVFNSEGSEFPLPSAPTTTDVAAGAEVKSKMDFALPADASGLYRAQIEATSDSTNSDQTLATSSLELGVNPLPKSILIFCAHPDDEGAHLGIIRAAVENKIPLHFVYFTSGDAGSCDRYYQHSCGPAEALNFGALRMDEARAALGHLGVPREDIFFLGLPDGGSGKIWFDHVRPTNPYVSVMLASDHAPYEGLARPNLPYARESVVEMAKELIKRFQPEVLYTGHPDERHVDHRTNNWFVVKALQALSREGGVSPKLTLLVDQSYGPGPQAHAPYQYQKQVLHVSGEAMALGQESRWSYQSQDGNRAEGGRKTFDQLPRTETHWQVLDWKEHEGWNEKN